MMIGIILLLYLNGILAQNGCGRTSFKGANGQISAYTSNSTAALSLTETCTYQIRTPGNTYAMLEWKSFYIDDIMPWCYDESVIINTGCGYPRKVAEFCSRNMKSLPHSIYSRDNCITIVYTRKAGKSGGFLAVYNSYQKSQLPSRCSRKTFWAKGSGIINSPAWPSPYKSNSRSCSWKIQTGDSGKRIQLNIMDMDMYSLPNSACSSRYDYVYIVGEKSMTTKRRKYWSFCNKNTFRNIHSTINTAYYQLSVKVFTSNRYHNNRGFVIGFVVYEDELARSLSSWTSIVGGIAVAFIVFLFVFCCYRRYKRRQMFEQQPLVHSGVPVIAATVIHPDPNAAYPVQQPLAPSYPNVPPGYGDKPPPYQLPPYAPPVQGGEPGYPAYPPPAGYPPQGYPVYPPQDAPPGYPQQAPAYPQQAPAYPHPR